MSSDCLQVWLLDQREKSSWNYSSLRDKNPPVRVLVYAGTLVFDWEGQNASLVDQEEADLDDPEESVEQRHVHVVIVTIIHQAAVNILYQDKP